MIYHVLFACSKSKYHKCKDNLVWKEDTTIQSWEKCWKDSNNDNFKIKDLYSGRASKAQLKLITNHNNAIPYLISAGAGLIQVTEEVTIPSYESTFGNPGPSFEEWHLLPHGGLSKIKLNEDDLVVIFAPKNYLKAISKDPYIQKISDKLVVPAKSQLSKISKYPIDIHPRIKEVLGVASADLNTELIRIFLQHGQSKIQEINKKAEQLPPKPRRRKVSNEELVDIARENKSRTQMDLVRFIRDDLLISASVERISKARKEVIDQQ